MLGSFPRREGIRHTAPHTTVHTSPLHDILIAHGQHTGCPFFSSDRTRASVSLCSVIRRRCQVAHVLIRLVVYELAFVLFRAVFAESHDLGRIRVRVRVRVQVQV